jgi:phage tail sheath protein FI
VSSTPGTDGSTPIDLFEALSGTADVTTTWPQGSFAQLSNQILNINLPDASGVQGGTPAVNYTLINNVITWANGMQNVFLVVDGMYNGGFGSSQTVAASYTAMTAGSGGSTVQPSANVAIYGPWLSIVDPASGTSNATRWVPPGGAVLGVWAANDAQYNAAQTPAGTQAVVNAVALETYFGPTDLAALETAHINPIKIVPATGFCIFGGLTTSPGYPAKYININRALMKLAHDLTFITSYAVFKNNDYVLWQALTTTITNYLTQEMQDGLLAGNAPSNSFQVICDDTVNTPTTIAAGMVNATVSVALAAPAEFVVINLTQMASGATTSISS